MPLVFLPPENIKKPDDFFLFKGGIYGVQRYEMDWTEIIFLTLYAQNWQNGHT